MDDIFKNWEKIKEIALKFGNGEITEEEFDKELDNVGNESNQDYIKKLLEGVIK